MPLSNWIEQRDAPRVRLNCPPLGICFEHRLAFRASGAERQRTCRSRPCLRQSGGTAPARLPQSFASHPFKGQWAYRNGGAFCSRKKMLASTMPACFFWGHDTSDVPLATRLCQLQCLVGLGDVGPKVLAIAGVRGYFSWFPFRLVLRGTQL